jgi:hypothetical protein
MKYILLFAPTLLSCCFVAALSTQDRRGQQVPLLSPQERQAQIRLLHQQLDDISGRLRSLETRSARPFNPRGPLSSVSDSTANPVPPASQDGLAGTGSPSIKADRPPATTQFSQSEVELSFFRASPVKFGLVRLPGRSLFNDATQDLKGANPTLDQPFDSGFLLQAESDTPSQISIASSPQHQRAE